MDLNRIKTKYNTDLTGNIGIYKVQGYLSSVDVMFNHCSLGDMVELNMTESEFNEFKPSLKSAKTRFQLSAGLNLETLNTF